MPFSELSQAALRFFQHFISQQNNVPKDTHVASVLDGQTAVVAVESCIAQIAVLQEKNSRFLWLAEQQRRAQDADLSPLDSQVCDDAASALATALGLALQGLRVSCFIDHGDLCHAHLNQAVKLAVPLVVHLQHSPQQPLNAHFFNADYLVLYPQNVQQAVDFTLIARQMAETALLPVLIISDQEIAASLQNLHLPTPTTIAQFISPPQQAIPSPNVAQRLLLGEQRLAVPHWFDADNPVLLSPVRDNVANAWLNAGQAAYRMDIQSLLSEKLTAFYRLSQRQHAALSQQSPPNAQVFIAYGAVLNSLHSFGQAEVLGIHCLSPLPLADLQQALANKHGYWFSQHNLPILKAYLPKVQTVCYQHLPTTAELQAVLDQQDKPAVVYLGLDFTAKSDFPKRQVLLDELNRAYPALKKGGLSPLPATLVATGLRLAIQHNGNSYHRDDLHLTAVLLHEAFGGNLCCWPDSRTVHNPQWGQSFIDILQYDSEKVQALGDRLADLFLLSDVASLSSATLTPLKPQGLILTHQAVWEQSPVHWQQQWLAQYTVFCLPEAVSHTGQWVGALFGSLLQARLIEIKVTRLLRLWKNSVQRYQNLDILQLKQYEQRLQHSLDTVQRLDKGVHIGKPEQPQAKASPWLVQQLVQQPSYSSLAQFWDKVGEPFQQQPPQLGPDPLTASAFTPTLTASFHDLSPLRRGLPVFQAEKCNGCGLCWQYCPDSALAAIAISAKNLINHGIIVAKAQDMQRVSGALASTIARLGRNADNAYTTADAFIMAAFAELKGHTLADAQQQQAITSAVDKLGHYWSHFPLARTEVLFYQAEHYQHDSGEFLNIAINPDSCKACGLCVHACPHEALVFTEQTAEVLANSRRQWQLWQRLPDTQGDTLHKLSQHPDFDHLAAILLSRHCALPLTGGDGAESGSGEKAALRLVLGLAEFHAQPKQQQLLKQINVLQQKLVDKIRATVANALPSDDLQQLALGLNQLKTEQHSLLLLTQYLTQDVRQSQLNIPQLKQWVSLAQALAQWHWRLHQGQQGLGRARIGVVFSHSAFAQQLCQWPYNPLQQPAIVDITADSGALALGLLAGQVRQHLAEIALLRQAQTVLKNPDEALRLLDNPLNLKWNDLSLAEKESCPPLLLVADDKLLGKQRSALDKLLHSGWPIKVLILSAADFGLHAQQINPQFIRTKAQPPHHLALLALTHSQAYIAQTALRTQDTQGGAHLLHTVGRALAYTGSALLRVYAPSPQRDGFAPFQTFAQAQAAVQSGAWPLLRYDPETQGVFGLRLDLSGNPEHAGCVARWAFGQQRFAPFFQPLSPKAGQPIDFKDYLSLTSQQRANKAAVIEVSDENKTVKWQLLPELLAVGEHIAREWQMLQELAGVVTPFTDKVKQQVQQAMAEQHQNEIKQLQQQHQTQMQELRATCERELAEQVTQSLLLWANVE
jgi:pyruvate-ferredoxin/flavodoxin oxidoreductase